MQLFSVVSKSNPTERDFVPGAVFMDCNLDFYPEKVFDEIQVRVYERECDDFIFKGQLSAKEFQNRMREIHEEITAQKTK